MRGTMMLATSTLIALALGGCAEDDGRGTLTFEIWGEEFIEEGIPAEVFADGWAVTFDRFLVAVDGLEAARGGGAPDLTDDAQRIFDLTQAGPTAFLSEEVSAGRYDSTAYRLAPAGADAVAGNAAADDVAMMREAGYSVYVEGQALSGDVTKTFAWGFTRETVYSGCHSEADLADGGEATIQLTIHADHLFYDDLFAAEPDVTFTEIAAADADGDGEVTGEELLAHDIMALPNYGTGSLDVENLWDFVDHLTGTLGHIDGEGHCEAHGAGD